MLKLCSDSRSNLSRIETKSCYLGNVLTSLLICLTNCKYNERKKQTHNTFFIYCLYNVKLVHVLNTAPWKLNYNAIINQ